MTLPIGGADMPVVISLYNALTGLAVAFEGYVLGNPAMIIAGMVVGAAGTHADPAHGPGHEPLAGQRALQRLRRRGRRRRDGRDGRRLAADRRRRRRHHDGLRRQGRSIAPGYGMAVAQAQHKVWELAQLLLDRGVQVKFAIHPVAGRMPGHMNVLLAEAGVPYDFIYDIDDINPEFATTDVALVIGANDIVNLAARTDPGEPHLRHADPRRGQGRRTSS